MAGAHPGGAGQIRFIKPVAEWAFVQVVWGGSTATISVRIRDANRWNTRRNRPLNASVWTLVWLLVLSPAGQPT